MCRVDEYLRLAEHPGAVGDDSPAAAPSKKQAPAQPTGLSNAERQRLKKEVSSIERRLASKRERAEQLKASMAEVDPTDYQALEARQQEIDAAFAEVDELETAWLEASERLGE